MLFIGNFLSADARTRAAVWTVISASPLSSHFFVVCDEESGFLPFTKGLCIQFVLLQSYSEEFMFLLLLCKIEHL